MCNHHEIPRKTAFTPKGVLQLPASWRLGMSRVSIQFFNRTCPCSRYSPRKPPLSIASPQRVFEDVWMLLSIRRCAHLICNLWGGCCLMWLLDLLHLLFPFNPSLVPWKILKIYKRLNRPLNIGGQHSRSAHMVRGLICLTPTWSRKLLQNCKKHLTVVKSGLCTRWASHRRGSCNCSKLTAKLNSRYSDWRRLGHWPVSFLSFQSFLNMDLDDLDSSW